MNAAIGFAGTLGPMRPSEGLEAIPNNAFGLTIIGADVPNEAIGAGESVFQHFDESEISFAETATGDDDAKTGG